MRTLQRIVVLICISLASLDLALWSPALGATCAAATPNRADVLAAYNSCTAVGDTVTIPAGVSTTWSSAITITHGIKITGAGVSATTINGNGFTINLTVDNPVEISGIKFLGTGGTSQGISSNGSPAHPSHIVIHDTYLSGYFNAIHIDQGFGVMYNSTITGNEHNFRFGGYQSVPSGIPALPWPRNSVYFFVVEDNTIGPTSPKQVMILTDSIFPYMFRHNNISETGGFPQIFDLHGINSGDLNNIGVVLYENNLNLSTDGQATNLRGGTHHLVYNNHLTGPGGAAIEMDANCGGNCDPVNDTYIWDNTNFSIGAFGNTLNDNYFTHPPTGYVPGTSSELAYPHPFRSVADTTPPAAPQNLRAQ